MMRHFLILLFVVTLLQAQEYQIGQGAKVVELPLYVGGYITADYLSRSDGYRRVRLDDVALIAYGSYQRFSYLAEFEVKEGYVEEWGKVERTRSTKRLNTERLYVDYTASDTLEFRLGKFNTPVGYWNLSPISVLRDSASNPYLAYILYPRYTTGLQVSYEDHLHDGNAYTMIVQNNDDLDDEYNNIFINRHYGAGIEHIGERLSFKANAGHFRTTDNADFYYFLLAMQYEHEAYKISAEYGARRGSSEWTVPYTFYLQGVYALAPRHDLIGRFESYEIDEGAYRREEIGVVGYTYRPITPVTFKAEYQLHSYTNENQIHLSFAILF